MFFDSLFMVTISNTNQLQYINIPLKQYIWELIEIYKKKTLTSDLNQNIVQGKDNVKFSVVGYR